ncbi:glycosyltransferase [candidate division WS5 bacterium]|uniref:Glycosyltransferase n=1 Tax=candidate division WS5 bacterium TaxID=2093353 RepID=A0A419DDS8_9BACT|nr:MAG: glycosyltransferase [candidate division WS5 bacterium]
MKTTDYPRVLIIGQTFNYTSGSGITKANLFMGWPVDRIAVATFEKVVENVICKNYYQIGYRELKRPWPFNYLQNKTESGPVDVKNLRAENDSTINEFANLNDRVRIRNNILFSTSYNFFLHFLGVYNKIFVSKISDEFLKWLNDFKPDIIYDQLSSLASIRFLSQLHRITKIPIAIHIMDDWMSTINKYGLFYFYWKRVVDYEFNQLINKASVLMSICQEMSDEYEIRYKKKFLPFHNPIELDQWTRNSKTNWDFHKPFKILYCGRIGRGTLSSVVSIAKAVDVLANEGYEVVFQIQSTSANDQFMSKIRRFKNTVIKTPLAYNELPEKLSNMDLLVLPMDFDAGSLRFIRLSMPTKTSEYMATGTPVLVYAPGCTALSKYASREKWGYIVNGKNLKLLVDAIKLLYSDESLRKKIGTRAKEMARINHDAERVREDFRNALSVVH